ncbi:MAG: hypothetical protein ABTQ34_02890 [Bdellovibrionales bacterium]
MGTWSVPYNNVQQACLFAKMMADPWIAHVVMVPDLNEDNKAPEDATAAQILSSLKKKPQRANWEAPYLYGLAGSDAIFDELGELAERKRKNFDIRPIVKRHVASWLETLSPARGETCDMAAVTITRDCLGLKPLSPEEKKAMAFQIKAAMGKRRPVIRKKAKTIRKKT